MARLPRPDLADVTQHVVQRGNNRLPCFLDDEDRFRYLTALREVSVRYGCAVHAYVLMPNHVHLLVTPESVGAVGLMMQQLGRSYVSQFNARHERSGTLWEGRYKSCLVEGERYVLACYRYIELNPVRAGLVDLPDRYLWSSHGANAFGRSDGIVAPHPSYRALGSAEDGRKHYRAVSPTRSAQTRSIRSAVTCNSNARSATTDSRRKSKRISAALLPCAPRIGRKDRRPLR